LAIDLVGRKKLQKNGLYFCCQGVRKDYAHCTCRQPYTVTRESSTMSKITLTSFLLLLLLWSSPENYAAASGTATAAKGQLKQNVPESQPARRGLSPAVAPPLRRGAKAGDEGVTGTLQKMIVENGSVTMELDVNRLNGIQVGNAKLEHVQFAVAANSFFSILVFNNLLRGAGQGSMALVPQNRVALPAALTASINRLVIEKATGNEAFDVTVRDALSGFVFFDIQGNQYDYNASAQLLTIQGGRLLISKEFATALGRASDAGVQVGNISVGAAMQAIQITQLSNGAPKSVVPLRESAGPGAPALAAGPDVIVGDLPDMLQLGSAGSQVGLAVATTSCNNGDQPINWFALPNTDHPVVPQNFYRMSGGANNNERFEQIGQSWMKHTFGADELDQCNLGCNTNNCTQWTTLCPGCSDPYDASENGDRTLIGSRAWVNPFTGSFPSTADDHTGHVHDGASHRIRVEMSDLDPTQNQGATYFAEAAYITPHEYTWCQAHPGQCNMYNNVSYRQYNVSGSPPNFTFSPAGATEQKKPAIMAWTGTGTIVTPYQPDPGNDGIWFMGYKVTNPATGVWHYEYALYNMNLDRAIQSFSVPLGAGVNISNIDFHAPPQEPGFANDGTFNNQGYSSTPWTVTQASDSITWNTETIAQNQNANAIRWGTLYNFRFDSNQAPHTTTATVGFFKTGSPIPVVIEAPVLADATPTPTPTASPSVTPPLSPTPTATATPISTATATPTPTARATPTPRSTPEPRPRPTPPPRL
jgi:hypothetical protein